MFLFCCLFALQIDYPEIAEGVVPRHRFMSAYEQRVEPPDKKWQYLLFAAEPYETISFKVRDLGYAVQIDVTISFKVIIRDLGYTLWNFGTQG